jgi:hypothetical protein
MKWNQWIVLKRDSKMIPLVTKFLLSILIFIIYCQLTIDLISLTTFYPPVILTANAFHHTYMFRGPSKAGFRISQILQIKHSKTDQASNVCIFS